LRYADVSPEVVAAAQAGDERAFAAIVEHYQRPVFAVAWRMTFDAALAEDFAQEVFLRLWRKLHKFKLGNPLRPWLMRLAKNTCINLAKKKRVPTVSIHAEPDEGDWREPADGRPGADETVEHRELLERLEAAIAELPEDYRLVVTLRHVHGMAYQEIAEALECPLGTVKVRLFRARERLGEMLAPMMGDEPDEPV
jgi:RNA polymerase sigma-70 factor (ECF subfamily)